MKILLIDTTTSFVTISIIENDVILYNYYNQITTDMSSKLIPIIDEAFSNVQFELKDIDKILVANGPGSFTGIRVGVTIAKTIAWSLKKDIVPISSLELMATTPTEKRYIVPMIDARRGNVFGGIYDTELKCIKSDRLISLNELTKDINNDYEFVSYDDVPVTLLSRPKIDIIKIVDKHKNDRGVNPHNLNPNYLKLTEAEENKLKDD